MLLFEVRPSEVQKYSATLNEASDCPCPKSEGAHEQTQSIQISG